jgi:hypothetical protein
MKPGMKFDHIGIPTAGPFDGEIPKPRLKITVSTLRPDLRATRR